MTDNPLAIVFLHYFGGSAREWEGLTAALSLDHPCLALNLRGHGGKGDGDGYERGIGALVYEVAAEIDEARLTQYVLVGHSMGGKIALELASRRPAGLRGLFLLSPSPPTPEPMSGKDRADSLANWENRAASEKALQKITHRPVSAAAANRFVDDNFRTTKAVWDWWYRTGSREDISERMGRVVVPVLIAAGSEDTVITPNVHRRETAARLANAQMEIVPQAGHLLADESPEAIGTLLRRFIISLTA